MQFTKGFVTKEVTSKLTLGDPIAEVVEEFLVEDAFNINSLRLVPLYAQIHKWQALITKHPFRL